jgi:hypothetical protein
MSPRDRVTVSIAVSIAAIAAAAPAALVRSMLAMFRFAAEKLPIDRLAV